MSPVRLVNGMACPRQRRAHAPRGNRRRAAESTLASSRARAAPFARTELMRLAHSARPCGPATALAEKRVNRFPIASSLAVSCDELMVLPLLLPLPLDAHGIPGPCLRINLECSHLLALKQ